MNKPSLWAQTWVTNHHSHYVILPHFSSCVAQLTLIALHNHSNTSQEVQTHIRLNEVRAAVRSLT